jgi:hypothetical protein
LFYICQVNDPSVRKVVEETATQMQPPELQPNPLNQQHTPTLYPAFPLPLFDYTAPLHEPPEKHKLSTKLEPTQLSSTVLNFIMTRYTHNVNSEGIKH